MISGAMDWSSGCLSLIPFASFAWAIKGHFVCPGPMPYGMRALSALSLVAYVSFVTLLLQHSAPTTVLLVTGGQWLFCLATMIFWWSVGATSATALKIAYKEGEAADIVTTGPYALVRHPFYLAYMLFWIGTAMIVGSWQWLPILILIVWYVVIARSEERRLDASGHTASYAQYRCSTGMFLPSVRR